MNLEKRQNQESEALGWVVKGRQRIPLEFWKHLKTFYFQLENKKFSGVSRKLLEIHGNECREAASSREWERIHEKSASQTWNLKKSRCIAEER